jgi:hypothetical protein
MRKSEREHAAALIVRACHALGDAWKAISLEELVGVLHADAEDKREPFYSLERNPFFRPDFWKLADGEFGRWTGEPGKSPVELTEHGIEAMRRWVAA